MRFVLANVGFEYELAGRPRNGALVRQEARFSTVLRLVRGWRDAMPLPATGVCSAVDVLPWGMSEQARERAPSAACTWPSVDVTRWANDKRTSHDLERALGCELPGATIATSVAEVAQLRKALARPLVVKHPFGVAGREQTTVDEWDDQTARRVENLLSAGGVVVEPRVEVTEEFSVHFQLHATHVELIGCTRLLTGPRGEFRGNITGAEPPAPMVATAREAAQKILNAGYVGPLGVDAFLGTLDGVDAVRPITELNARWTFGRLALELALSHGADLSWHHPARGAQPANLQPLSEKSKHGTFLLPDDCDPCGGSGTYIELLCGRREIDGSAGVC